MSEDLEARQRQLDVDRYQATIDKLWSSLQSGDLDALKKLCTEDKALVNINNAKGKDKDSDTALMKVVRVAKSEAHFNCFKYLIDAGADVKKGNSMQETVFHVLAQKKTMGVEIIEYLLDHVRSCKDAVNSADGDGKTAVMLAAGAPHDKGKPILATLLGPKCEVDIYIQDSQNQSALFHAVMADNRECLLLLMEHLLRADKTRKSLQAELSRINRSEASLLILASGVTHSGCLKLLLQHTPREMIDHADETGTAVYHACASDQVDSNGEAKVTGQHEALRELILAGADINKKARESESPLYVAATSGHAKCVSVLLEHGVDATQKQLGKTAQEAAAEKGWDEVAELIAEHVRLLEEDIPYALRILATAGDNRALALCLGKLTLDHATQEETINEFGGEDEMNPVLLACKFGRTANLELLIKNQGRPNSATSSELRTGAIFACMHGHPDCLHVLMELGSSGYSVAKTKYINETPLQTACEHAQDSCIRLILSHHLTLIAEDGEIETPLTMRFGKKGSEKTPFQLYLARGGDFVDSELVLKFISMDLPYDAQGGFRSHGFSWVHFLSPDSGLSEPRCLEIVKEFIKRLEVSDQGYRSFVRKLALAEDERKRVAVHHTHKEVKRYIEKESFFCGRYELVTGPPAHISEFAVVIFAKDHDAESFFERAFDEQIDAAAGETELSKEKFRRALEWLKRFGIYDHFSDGDSGAGGDEALEDHFKTVHRNSVMLHRRRSSFAGRSGAASQGPTGVSKEQFVQFCEEHVSETVSVAIKFMAGRDNWVREKKVRTDANLDVKHVVGLLLHEDEDEALVIGSTKTEFYEDGAGVFKPLSDFPYTIVMPAADRSLAYIFRCEKPDMRYLKTIIRDVCEALDHCHQRHIIHGDVKMANIIRVGRHCKLIDMDGSVDFGRGEYAGEKYSSANIPPEMFYELKDEAEARAYAHYWADKSLPTDMTDEELRAACSDGTGSARKLAERWMHVKPVRTIDRDQTRTFVVRTFFSQATVQQDVDSKVLPYTPVHASPAFDVWAFGILCYNLLVGKPLLASNLDEELIHTSRLQEHLRAATWSASDGTNSLERVLIDKPLDPDAIHFLVTLLNPDVTARSQVTMAEMLKHPFLQLGPDAAAPPSPAPRWLSNKLKDAKLVHETKMKIENDVNATPRGKTNNSSEFVMAARTVAQLLVTEKILMRNKMTTEVPVPQVFILVPFRLPLAVADEASYYAWVKIMTKISENSGHAKSSSAALAEAVREATGQALFLYLLDEHTMLPVVPRDAAGKPLSATGKSVYPILLDGSEPATQHLLSSVLLPLARVTLRAAEEMEDASIATCLGYPWPVSELSAKEKALHRKACPAPNASAREFDLLTRGRADLEPYNGSSTPSQRDLREPVGNALQRFFLDKDPQLSLAGLTRVQTPVHTAVWITADSLEEMKRPPVPPVPVEKIVEVEKVVKEIVYERIEVPVGAKEEEFDESLVYSQPPTADGKATKFIHLMRLKDDGDVVRRRHWKHLTIGSGETRYFDQAERHDGRLKLVAATGSLGRPEQPRDEVLVFILGAAGVDSVEWSVPSKGLSAVYPQTKVVEKVEIERLVEVPGKAGGGSAETKDAIKQLFDKMTDFARLQVALEKSHADQMVAIQAELQAQGRKGGWGWCCGGKESVAVLRPQSPPQSLTEFKFVHKPYVEEYTTNPMAASTQYRPEGRSSSASSLTAEKMLAASAGGKRELPTSPRPVEKPAASAERSTYIPTPPIPSDSLPEGWVKKMDKASGNYYYVNRDVDPHITQWERPETPAALAESHVERPVEKPAASAERSTDSPAPPIPSDSLPEGWVKVMDKASGNYFYVNRDVDPHITQWERPPPEAPKCAPSAAPEPPPVPRTRPADGPKTLGAGRHKSNHHGDDHKHEGHSAHRETGSSHAPTPTAEPALDTHIHDGTGK